MINYKLDNIEKKNLLILIFIYIFTRITFYFLLEIKANPIVINPGWHVLELSFLNKDLFNSIIHLHSQPPLWNIIIGIFTKLVNGDLIKTSILLNIFNYFLSIGIMIYAFKILSILNFKKISFFIILFLVILNPNIIFYENITFYNHILNFLFVTLVWIVILFFKTKKNVYEILIYLNITVQSLIWAGIHPVLTILVFLTISYLKKSIINKNSLFFLLIFFISISPLIKNKIVFNKFSSSTWLGLNLSSTMGDVGDKMCNYQVIYTDHYEVYNKKYNRKIIHPVAREKSGHAYRNSVSQIILDDKCLKLAINKIKEVPLEYAKRRVISFFVSHSKFGFEYIYLTPLNFKFNDLKNFMDENHLIKRIKQFSFILYMLFFYVFFLRKIVNKNDFQKPSLLIIFIYLFCNLVSHLFNGYEQERFMYQFLILHIIFISNFILNLNEKINEKKY